MKYGLLRQQSPDYDGPYWSILTALYKGGRAAQAVAAQVIPKLPGESDAKYEARLRSAAYMPYLGQIIDYFVSGLFGQDLSVSQPADAQNKATPGQAPDSTDPYVAFAANADLKGTTFTMLMRRVMCSALLRKRAIIAVDFPAAPPRQTPRYSAADERALGLARPYADELALERVIDWEYGEEIVVDSKVVGHTFELVVIYRCVQRRASLAATRGTKTHQWKVWQRDPATGVVSWALYELVATTEKPPQDDDDVPQTDGGVTTFAQIPLIELELPDGLWAGGKLETLVTEHWARRTALVTGENQSLMAIAVLEAPDDIPAAGGGLPSPDTDVAKGNSPINEARRKGYVVQPKGAKLYFAEPSGAAFSVVDGQLKDLKDECFRVAHQMSLSADNSSSTMRRSGESKKADRSDMIVVLQELAKYARDLAERVFACISAARNEDVKWQARGLDKFDTIDREVLVAEAVAMDQIQIPSTTFHKIHKTQVAEKLLENVSETEMETIRKEIEAGAKADEALRTAKAKAALDAVTNPPPPAAAPVPGQVPAQPPKAPPAQTPPAKPPSANAQP